jgi:hypothetical protein
VTTGDHFLQDASQFFGLGIGEPGHCLAGTFWRHRGGVVPAASWNVHAVSITRLCCGESCAKSMLPSTIWPPSKIITGCNNWVVAAVIAGVQVQP